MGDEAGYTPPLPPPGRPFRVGDEVAFFPAVIGPTSNWLRLDFAVIDDINEDTGTFGFHFVGEPGTRHAQDLENIVRRSLMYEAWRSAWQASFDQNQDERFADRDAGTLRLQVLAQHPIHGHALSRDDRPRR
jgi:hypothetical protein